MHIAFLQVGPGIGPITNNNFRFSQELIKLGHKVDLVGTNVAASTYEKAPETIRIISLQSNSNLATIRGLSAYLKKENPDYLLPSGAVMHVVSAIAKMLSRSSVKIYTRTHIETSLYLKERGFLNRQLLRFLLWAFRNVADGHIAASRGAADDLARVIGVPQEKIDVLYNPSIDDDIIAMSHENVSHPWIMDRSAPVIVCVARLVEQKGIDTLVSAMALVNKRRKVRLIILGEGDLRGKFERQASDLRVDDLVDFHGHLDNPFKFMRKADLFVLSSNYEGFANVVAEALACGCPVVSTDAPSGPREILSDGDFGTIVPVRQPVELSKAILASLETSHDMGRLTSRGMRFHVRNITADLVKLLK
ncbi:glycosyltransferase [Tropicimonas sp. IMCC34011]|uniref:glycosyltransferase n=1 Tax=Tropicimonas sp. IMCC34011 TaxID=2248759 RepID=UPI000E287C6C|nr:glycosyltransferase [Tropicimonas sp. IMCC34011]